MTTRGFCFNPLMISFVRKKLKKFRQKMMSGFSVRINLLNVLSGAKSNLPVLGRGRNRITLLNSSCALLSSLRLTTICDLTSFVNELASRMRNFSAPPTGKAGATYIIVLCDNLKRLFSNKVMTDRFCFGCFLSGYHYIYFLR